MDEDSPFVQELYAFRKLYNALLFNEWVRQGLFQVHKSKKHSDGTKCFGGDMFIVAALLPTGQISQHYYVEDWVDTGERGRSKGDKKLIVIAVQKVKGNKIGSAYAEVIENASAESFRPFFEKYIDKDNARVITDGWRGYWPLESEFEIKQKLSGGGKNFPGLHFVIMNLKG